MLNGYELTPSRAGEYGAHAALLRLSTRAAGPARQSRLAKLGTTWRRRQPTGRNSRSACCRLRPRTIILNDHYADTVEIVVYEGTTDAMREVETGKLDATLADLPADDLLSRAIC